MNELVGSAVCPHCNTSALHVTDTNTKGYAVQLQLTCEHCDAELSSVYSTPKLSTSDNPTRQPFMINRLAVLAAREGGINQTGLVRLTTLMNVRGGIHHKTFSKISDTLRQKMFGMAVDALTEAHDSVRRVHRDIYGESDGPLELSVSYEMLTGLVIDYVVCSKYCVERSLVGSRLSGDDKVQWQELHKDSCDINHTGSSGSMETEDAKIIWARSVDLFDAKYTSILGDGDAAVLCALNNLQPYGADAPIEKHECINHMGKRMFKGLEKIMKESGKKGKGKDTGGGKPKKQIGVTSLSGKGKLTAVRMKCWSQ